MERSGRNNGEDSSTLKNKVGEGSEDREQIADRERDNHSSDCLNSDGEISSQANQIKTQREAYDGSNNSILHKIPVKSDQAKTSSQNKASVLWTAFVGLMTGLGLGIAISHVVRRKQEEPEEQEEQSFQTLPYKPFQVIQGGKK